MAIPVVDLAGAAGPDARKIADRIGAACRDVGFFAIVNAGVPRAVEAAAWDAARAFFDLPLADRLAAQVHYPGYPYGYVPYLGEGLAYSRGEATPPDLKESFSCAFVAAAVGPTADPDATFAHCPNLWPSALPGFAAAMEAYYRAMAALAARLMGLFALALDLPHDFFAPAIDRHISALRILNYPEPERTPAPGQIRAGAHTDYGSLTVLRQQAAPGGLQVQGPDGGWLDVPALDDGYVVNLGDLMQRWTNDRWRSTLHRVVNPPPDARGRSRRQSIAFFHQPNWDAEIACLPSCLAPGETPRHPPVRSGPHLMAKYRSTVAFEPAAGARPV
ncbi:MAG: 2-oxoglutarate and iron-dependent oxygenase domain-containing protein [Alphaproteobacteria bacterium]